MLLAMVAVSESTPCLLLEAQAAAQAQAQEKMRNQHQEEMSQQLGAQAAV